MEALRAQVAQLSALALREIPNGTRLALFLPCLVICKTRNTW